MAELLRAGVSGRLLVDVDAMAGHLDAAGWVRGLLSGSWECPDAPAWSVGSSDHDPHVSVFAHGSDDLVTRTSEGLKALLDSGDAGAVRPGEPDSHWILWHTDAVVVSLHASAGRRFGRRWVDASLHLALERTDTPPEGRPHDPDRDLAVARTGSPVARWYLAGQDVLADDVVAQLAGDDDPAVRAALAAGAEERQITKEQQEQP
ncbi:hypothetical protein [Pseudokineococcus sp. 1T1Z-3]|uniref:hypothetical protein n=1 Tax=Pseudokineococcus sp. 1T1Z-3 TaxID=3132745 RepID=UPI0030B503D3